MRILAAARHPGPGEAIGPVAQLLRDSGHDVLLIGVRNDSDETKVHGGSATIFERQGIPFTELTEAGYRGDVVGIPESFAESLIESYAPDRIVVGCSLDATGEQLGIEEVLLAVGSARLLRTVHVIETWNVWYPRKDPLLPSVFAVIDEFAYKIMEARGAPPDRIAVTGHPGLDAYVASVVPRRPKEGRGLGTSGERVLVYFGQAENSEGLPDNPTTLGWVIDALQPSDRLIFSQHPRDDRDYSRILERAGPSLIVTSWTGDRLLSAADVCLTHYSMMGLKSALLDIPTISILTDEDWPDIRALCGGFPMSLLGGGHQVRSRNELKDALSSEFVGDSARLARGLHVDGKAAHRVSQLVTG